MTNLGERLAGLTARRDPATVGRGRVNRRLQREFEQPRAIEIGRKRIADVTDRSAHSRLFAFEVVETARRAASTCC